MIESDSGVVVNLGKSALVQKHFCIQFGLEFDLALLKIGVFATIQKVVYFLIERR